MHANTQSAPTMIGGNSWRHRSRDTSETRKGRRPGGVPGPHLSPEECVILCSISGGHTGHTATQWLLYPLAVRAASRTHPWDCPSLSLARLSYGSTPFQPGLHSTADRELLPRNSFFLRGPNFRRSDARPMTLVGRLHPHSSPLLP